MAGRNWTNARKALLWIGISVGAVFLTYRSILFLVYNVSCLDCLLLISHGHGCRERTPSTSLKTIASAQADYRANDRDGNGLRDYWRGDIAGLYCRVNAKDLSENPEPIKLIELSVASADHTPASEDITFYTVRSQKAGYWYRALRFVDEQSPDPNRFAACCFPGAYRQSGRITYILSDRNELYGKDLGHGMGVTVYPANPIEEGWTRLD